MSERQPASPEATPAATVVPLRDGSGGLEVLLLRRGERGAFGGMWVFPGGQVDEADRVEAGAADSGESDEIRAARRAAVREAQEEAGLVIAQTELVTLSFWMPPPQVPRRFATWFFLAPVPSGEVVVDLGEISEFRWARPADALAERDAGTIELAPPTYMTLRGLTDHGDVDAALAATASRAPERFATHAVARDGVLAALLWEGDAGYETSDLDAPGPRRRLHLDPAGWRVELAP